MDWILFAGATPQYEWVTKIVLPVGALVLGLAGIGAGVFGAWYQARSNRRSAFGLHLLSVHAKAATDSLVALTHLHGLSIEISKITANISKKESGAIKSKLLIIVAERLPDLRKAMTKCVTVSAMLPVELDSLHDRAYAQLGKFGLAGVNEIALTNFSVEKATAAIRVFRDGVMVWKRSMWETFGAAITIDIDTSELDPIEEDEDETQDPDPA